jgi:uncharacterized membrane protein
MIKKVSIGILVTLFVFTIVSAIAILGTNTPHKKTNESQTFEIATVKAFDTTQSSSVLVEINGATSTLDVTEQAIGHIAIGDKLKVFKLDTDPEDTAFDEPSGAGTGAEPDAGAGTEPVAEPEYGFYDFDRTPQTIIILIIWFLIIIAVARLKGLASIYGLIMAMLVVIYFTIPSIFSGANPILLGFVTSSLVMFLVQFFAHGFNMKTVTALLGTVFGLFISSTISYFIVEASKVWKLADENAGYLIYSSGNNVGVYSLVISAMIISSLGALNDTTVTQASSVKELLDLDQTLSKWELYKRAMRIGRDHIASTVYTISLVYMATLLPTIMLMLDSGYGFWDTFTSYSIMTELLSVIAGSIGLIIAVPLTTLIATVTMSNTPIYKETHSHISSVN